MRQFSTLHRCLLSLMLIMLIFVMGYWGASAQVPWSMWVYQADSGRLLHVDNNGQVIVGQNIPAIGTTYPTNLVISPDGNRVAYQHPNQQQITVLDLASGIQLAQINLSEIGIAHNDDDFLLLDDIAFTQASNHLVYGEILGGLGWQIHVYDLESDQTIQTLMFGDEQAGQYRALHGGVRPIITHINGDRITFTVDIDFPVRVHSYHWFYEADILSETVAAPTLLTTAFAYDDAIISAQFDGRFPTENENFAYRWQQINTLYAYTGIEGRFPVFYDGTLSFQKLWVVQGGERLLVQAYVDDIVDVWILIDRDGNEIRRYPVAGFDTTGTPDGYIYATTVGDQTAIVTVDTRNSDNAGSTVWIQPDNWQILWAGRYQAENGFTAWVQLAQSQQDPTGIVERYATPTLAPDLPPFRQVGMPIQIYVPEEGFLNLRDAPSTNSTVVTLLESGTRGIISDGPVLADGFIWWQVSIANRIGWVVEELPDSLALIPPQVIASITPTATATERP